MTVPDWRPYFPFDKPRPEQERALDWICEKIWSGERIVVAELGTGIGKSAIAIALGGWSRHLPSDRDLSPGVTVLTSQKVLQDQYVRDFKNARDLRSAANFSCGGPVGGSCGETSRIRKAVGPDLAPKLMCSGCPYRAAKDDFVSAEAGITNYSYFLSEAMYAAELPPRKMLVLDEVHNVEDEVRRWASVEVTENDADERKLSLPPLKISREWLEDHYKPALQARMEWISLKLKRLVKAGKASATRSLGAENDKLDKRICQVNRLLDKGGELLVSEHTDKMGMRSIRFQPVEIRGIADELLYSRAGAVVMTSATLLSREVFSHAVGVEDAPFLSLPTTFKPSSFGLTFRPVGRMSRDSIEATIQQLPRAIERILAKHPDQKGIIHTTNYRVTRALAGVRNKRLLVQTEAGDRAGMLQRHLSDPSPTVLVSPSMMEGLDLRDDLGRFQIVCKVPYPDMSDPLVGRKDRSWYNWRTARSLVQAVGRGVRSDSDWTKTYILDLCFLDLLERCPELFPEHLRKGLSVEES